MAHAMRSLGTMVGELRSIIVQQSRELASLKARLDAPDPCAPAVAATPAGTSAAGVTPAAAPAAATSTAAARSADQEEAAADDQEQNETWGPERSDESPLAGFGSLLPMGKSATTEKLSELDTPEIYLKWYDHGGAWPGLDKREVSKVATVIKPWLDSVATEGELALMANKGGNAGARQRLAHKLGQYVRQRLAAAFKSASDDGQSGKIPPSLRKSKTLAATGIISRLNELKKMDPLIELTIENANMEQFRRVMDGAST
eukprot:5681380-Prymnesium_polylepis.1